MSNNKTGWKVWVGGLLVVGLAGFGFIFMALKKGNALDAETKSRVKLAQEGPVIVKSIKAGTSAVRTRGWCLLREARSLTRRATLYAKTGGYMNKILVDKGDNVHAGPAVGDHHFAGDVTRRTMRRSPIWEEQAEDLGKRFFVGKKRVHQPRGSRDESDGGGDGAGTSAEPEGTDGV